MVRPFRDCRRLIGDDVPIGVPRTAVTADNIITLMTAEKCILEDKRHSQ